MAEYVFEVKKPRKSYPDMENGTDYEAVIKDIVDAEKMVDEYGEDKKPTGKKIKVPSRKVIFEIVEEGEQKGRYLNLNHPPKMNEKANWVTKFLSAFYDKVAPGFTYDDSKLISIPCRIFVRKGKMKDDGTQTHWWNVDRVARVKGFKVLSGEPNKPKTYEVKVPAPSDSDVPF